MDKVQFWMKPEYLSRLTKRAERYGLKPNEFARKALMEVLDDTEREEMEHELSTLQAEVRELSSVKTKVQDLETEIADHGKFILQLEKEVITLQGARTG